MQSKKELIVIWVGKIHLSLPQQFKIPAGKPCAETAMRIFIRNNNLPVISKVIINESIHKIIMRW